MGDSYQTLAFPNVARERAEACSSSVTDFLVERGIISAEKAFSQGYSCAYHSPGPRAEAVTDGTSFGSGEVVVITEKTVFHTSGNGPPEFMCPGCDRRLRDGYAEPGQQDGEAFVERWIECVEKWWDSESGEAEEVCCPQCGYSERFDLWPCEYTWAFGHCGIRFSNWPPLRADLIERLQHVTGEKIVWVCGHS